MGNISMAFKKFLTNKNTVTVIGVLLVIVVLYVGYNYRINSKINPQSVPYALNELSPKTKITKDMIGTTEVPPAMLRGDPLTDARDIINKYVRSDTIIPAGSLFYKSTVVSLSELPDSIIYNYPEDFVLVNMAVNTTNTYGNKVYPGNYIDIYLKIVKEEDVTDGNTVLNDKTDKIMIGKLLENVKVLDVLDASGDSVFENVEEKKTPAQIIFAVPEEYHILLRKTMYLRTYEATLIPVPTAESLKKNPGEVAISNTDLKDFINQITVWTDDNAGTPNGGGISNT
ncbi:MAG: Flp pilus assembly protein CpaB [Bacilli bacterium]|nr:Flp pilus assembly protein CpaB [Bacilli bacterium]